MFSVEPAIHEQLGTLKISDNLCCDRKMVLFKVMREVRQVSGRIMTFICRSMDPD